MDDLELSIRSFSAMDISERFGVDISERFGGNLDGNLDEIEVSERFGMDFSERFYGGGGDLEASQRYHGMASECIEEEDPNQLSCSFSYTHAKKKSVSWDTNLTFRILDNSEFDHDTMWYQEDERKKFPDEWELSLLLAEKGLSGGCLWGLEYGICNELAEAQQARRRDGLECVLLEQQAQRQEKEHSPEDIARLYEDASICSRQAAYALAHSYREELEQEELQEKQQQQQQQAPPPHRHRTTEAKPVRRFAPPREYTVANSKDFFVDQSKPTSFPIPHHIQHQRQAVNSDLLGGQDLFRV